MLAPTGSLIYKYDNIGYVPEIRPQNDVGHSLGPWSRIVVGFWARGVLMRLKVSDMPLTGLGLVYDPCSRDCKKLGIDYAMLSTALQKYFFSMTMGLWVAGWRPGVRMLMVTTVTVFLALNPKP